MSARAPINLRDYLVLESSDLDHEHVVQSGDNEGAVEVPAGGDAVLCEYEPSSTEGTILLHALGVTNAQGLQYQLEYGQNISFRVNGWPGTYSNPFSFTDEFDAPLTSAETVTLRAINETGSSILVVGVMHVELAGGGN